MQKLLNRISENSVEIWHIGEVLLIISPFIISAVFDVSERVGSQKSAGAYDGDSSL